MLFQYSWLGNVTTRKAASTAMTFLTRRSGGGGGNNNSCYCMIGNLYYGNHHNNNNNQRMMMMMYHLSYNRIQGIATRTNPMLMGLEEFRDPVTRAERSRVLVGRKWSVKQLRRKNYDDLHKLWLVLYKERNMLLTELQISRRKSIIFPQPDRFRKVQKSMAAIKHVLGERKRAAIAAHEELKMLEDLQRKGGSSSSSSSPIVQDDHDDDDNDDDNDDGDNVDDEEGGDGDDDDGEEEKFHDEEGYEKSKKR